MKMEIRLMTNQRELQMRRKMMMRRRRMMMMMMMRRRRRVMMMKRKKRTNPKRETVKRKINLNYPWAYQVFKFCRTTKESTQC